MSLAQVKQGATTKKRWLTCPPVGKEPPGPTSVSKSKQGQVPGKKTTKLENRKP